MLEAADADGWRVIAYLVVAGLALRAFQNERRRDSDPSAWPTFWLMSTGLLIAMAVGRAGHVGAWMADLVRDRAVDRGWYEDRRSLQAAVVALVGGSWLATVALSCWRIPERRRRYLPVSLALATMGAFTAVRLVSLHQVDGLLQRRLDVGLRVSTVVESVLLAIVAVLTVWSSLTTAGHRTFPVPEEARTPDHGSL